MTQLNTKSNPIEYMHFRPIFRDVSGGATVAIMPRASLGTALISVARCGPMDNFNKKIGRDVATGRLSAYLAGRQSVASHVREIAVPDMLKLKETVAMALENEMADNDLA